MNSQIEFDALAAEKAIEALHVARQNLDGFLGEREIYESLDPYLVGRASAADQLLLSVEHDLTEKLRQAL